MSTSLPNPKRRLNLRALAVLAVLIVVTLPALIALKAVVERTGQRRNLVEAERLLARKQPALALGYLNRYLELNPDDPKALAIKAGVLAESAQTEEQVAEAVRVYRSVLGRAPNGPEAQRARRRLAALSLKIPGQARSAESQARELIKRGADDADAHRLLARALERIGVSEKKPEVMEEARKEYEKAGADAPGDVEAAEQLARLYRLQLDDPVKAQEVLDHLVAFTVKTPRNHAAALLARARHFFALRERSKGEADVLEAVQDDPSGLDSRLAAAEVALLKRDADAARHHLAAIAPAYRDDMRIKVAEGRIDLLQQRPDAAIAQWRAGLVRVGGGDAELTWSLAHILLETGRVAEARPLLAQYRRLVGGETPDVRYRYLAGLSLLKSNQPAAAIAALEAIRYKVDKTLEPLLDFALGQAYEATRNTAKAVESYQQAAEVSNEWSDPWTSLARLQLAADPEEAAATLRRGLSLIPNDPRLLTALARVLWRAQMNQPVAKRSWDEFEKARAAARAAAPGSAELALVEADYYNAVNRPDDALALLQTAAGLNPKAPEVWLALAGALAARKNLGQAVDAIDRATDSAGPQAAFAMTKASLLLIKGRVGEARKTLVEALDRVPDAQKPVLWKTLGEFSQARGDLESARGAFEAWAKIQPENPEPRLALVEVAMAGADDDAVAMAVEALRGVGGPKAYSWRLARVEELLRARPKEKQTVDHARDAKRLDEAEALVKEIQANDPQIALGFLLEARIAEKRGQVDRAVAAYKNALRLNAGPAALNPLVALLLREKRDDELQRLRDGVEGRIAGFDRLATLQAIRAGDKDRAEQLAALAVQGDPQGLDVRVWQAQVLKALGKPEAAEEALKTLTTLRPGEAAPWLQLLMLQIARRETEAAAATVEQIRSHVKPEYPELFWAQCYRAVGNVQRAEECFQDALRRWPDQPKVLAAAVANFEQTGRRVDAEAALRRMLKRDPNDRWARRKLALSLAGHAGNRDAWNEAVALIGADRQPDDVPDDLVARATVYAKGAEPEDRRKALAIFEALLNDLPNLAAIQDQAARLLFNVGDLRGALGHAAKAAAGDSASTDAILFYAVVLLAVKDLDGAEAQLDRLTSLDPDALPVAELRARILIARGKKDEAARVLEKAYNDRAEAPEGAAVADKMVGLLTTLNEPDAAERVARRAARLGPAGRIRLAELLADRGKVDDALALLDEVAKGGDPIAAGGAALAIATRATDGARWLERADRDLTAASERPNPTADLLQKIALLRHLQRRYPEEVATYRTLLERRADDFLFLNNMAWTLSENLDEPAEGLKWADEAVKKIGAVPHLLDTRGVVLGRLNRLDAAARDLETSAAAQPSAAVYFHLARVYRKMNKTEEFRRCRDRARALGIDRARLDPSEQADWDDVMAP